jgi:c-di-GMP-binding flagellar brake protein YcgR
VPLPHGFSAETNALIAGDLGDVSFRIDSYAESMELVRRVEGARQALTLVVMDLHTPSDPQLVLAFSSNVFRVNEEQQCMEFDLPMAAPHIGKNMMLRGSVKLQGVIVTFECETLGTHVNPQNRDAALTTRLPYRLYRMQRRDSFRVPVPISTGIAVTLKPGAKHLENIKALDLSCGGVSLLLRSPLDEVRLGSRFMQGMVKLTNAQGTTTHQVEMLVRHVRVAPQGMNQLLTQTAPAGKAAAVTPTSQFREAALQAMGAAPRTELVQLGIEFGRMPMSLDRSLAKLVNELGVNLMTRVKDDL